MITRDNIDARVTEENIVAVLCKWTATNTKSLIELTARPKSCARIVNVTFTGPPVSNGTVGVPSTLDPMTNIIAPSIRRDRHAHSVALTCAGPKPSRVIVAGTLIVTTANNTWTLNLINVSFKFGRWTRRRDPLRRRRCRRHAALPPACRCVGPTETSCSTTSTPTPCNRPFTCSVTSRPNKSKADTYPITWSVSAPTTTSSIGGTVTRAYKSSFSN